MLNIKKIHIVHIIPSLGFGGAERFVVDLINNSDPEKFKFSIIVFSDNLALAAQLRVPDVQIYRIIKKGKWSLSLFGAVKRKLIEIKPDIVHTHLFAGDWWGRLPAKRLGLKVLTTEHNINDNEGWFKNCLRRCYRDQSDYYTACSDEVRRYALCKYGITKPMETVRYGIEIQRYAAVPEIQLNKPFKLLMLGRLTEQKGHLIAFRALAALGGYDWQFRIVGAGELKSQLMAAAEQLGIKDKVQFSEPSLDVPKVLSESDILLMPSRWEGLGIVVMEAMAAGRLIVGSRVGGIPELVTAGETGFLVPPGGVKALGDKLKWCFEQREECREMARRARLYANTNFGVGRMVKKYEEIYNKISNF